MGKYGRWVLSAMAAGVLCSWANAQPREGDTVGFVTVLVGGGATLGAGGPAYSDDAGKFRESTHGVRVGERVVTGPIGSAVVYLSAYGIVIHIGPDTEVSFAAMTGLSNEVPVVVRVFRGRAQAVRKAADKAWFLFAGGSGTSGGYTLSKGASQIVEVDAESMSVTSTGGEVLFFEGSPPGGALIGDDGEPIDRTGVLVGQGQRVSQRVPEVKPEPATADAAWGRVLGDMYAFAVHQSGQWVEQAEQGDFTPVRSQPSGAARDLGVQVGETRQSFDQPRTTVTTPISNVTVSAVTTGQVNTARALLGSQIPSSVLIGQRIRRSRIIGNPGTTGSGQIRFNPSAEQLLLLSGGSGRR